MNYDIFLENNEKSKLNILQFILTKKNEILLDEIMVQTNLSRYKVIKLTNDLIHDINNVYATQPVQISLELHSKKSITNFNATFSTLRILRLHYLKESTTFKIFQYGFLENNHVPRQRFLSSNFISQAQYYNIREKVKMILDQADFFSDSNLFITNNEFLTRTALLNMYYFFYNGIEDPFPELKEITSKFINMVTMTFFLSMTPTQIAKLRVFFQLQVKRIQNRHSITDLNDYTVIVSKDKLTTLQKFYSGNIINNHIDLDSEIKALMIFIQSQGLTNDTILKNPAPMQQTIKNLNQKQIFIIKNSLGTTESQFID